MLKTIYIVMFKIKGREQWHPMGAHYNEEDAQQAIDDARELEKICRPYYGTADYKIMETKLFT